MHLPISSIPFLLVHVLTARLALAVDYGPCDYNGNENCREIMENTACFLNPRTPEQIFGCISGGASGVRYLPTYFTTIVA